MEREQATQFVDELLRASIAKRAFGVQLFPFTPPAFSYEDEPLPISSSPLGPEHVLQIVAAITPGDALRDFADTGKCEFELTRDVPGLAGRVYRADVWTIEGNPWMTLTYLGGINDSRRA